MLVPINELLRLLWKWLKTMTHTSWPLSDLRWRYRWLFATLTYWIDEDTQIQWSTWSLIQSNKRFSPVQTAKSLSNVSTCLGPVCMHIWVCLWPSWHRNNTLKLYFMMFELILDMTAQNVIIQRETSECAMLSFLIVLQILTMKCLCGNKKLSFQIKTGHVSWNINS